MTMRYIHTWIEENIDFIYNMLGSHYINQVCDYKQRQEISKKVKFSGQTEASIVKRFLKSYLLDVAEEKIRVRRLIIRHK